MAGWKRGAKQNPMPTSTMQRSTPAGPRSATTPSASSTSAAPTADDEARPPCLHTLAPVAATTRAAMVDTLMLRSRSPPVPQVSMTSMPAGRSRGTAWATMARTKPVISSTDSPLARRAVARAAIWAGVASPARTWPMTVSADATVSEVPDNRSVRTPGHPPNASNDGPEDATVEAVPERSAAGDRAISPTTDRDRGRPGR